VIGDFEEINVAALAADALEAAEDVGEFDFKETWKAVRTAVSPLAVAKESVVLGSNLFGDILSDLGPACTGTIAIAPSANINPEKNHPSMFEPVHGSAPDIAGLGRANPIGAIWADAIS
jgi:hypothetical protein